MVLETDNHQASLVEPFYIAFALSWRKQMHPERKHHSRRCGGGYRHPRSPRGRRPLRHLHHQKRDREQSKDVEHYHLHSHSREVDYRSRPKANIIQTLHRVHDVLREAH